MWIPRTTTNKLKKAAATRPVVLLTGARQTGKSSLLRKCFSEFSYVTFDHLHHLEAAQGDAMAFLRQQILPVIFDEIQYAPNLFRDIKIMVDDEREVYGNWILTGSQPFALMRGVSESLAGRVSVLELGTLSALELREAAVEGRVDFLWMGGYPELWGNREIDVENFFESYLRTYIERDLTALIKVRDLFKFRRFLRVVATRVGQLLNYSDLSSNMGISDVTCRDWIHALESSGVISLLPPYFANIGKRLVKSPKLYFSDHGLATYLLGITSINQWRRSPHMGNLWENLVFSELVKTTQSRPGDTLFFYRDHKGVEIDFIVEKAQRLHFIEAKASERVSPGKCNFKKCCPSLKDMNARVF